MYMFNMYKDRRRLDKDEKAKLLKRQNGLCYYCGVVLHHLGNHPHDGNRDPHWACVDHKKPYALGGKTNLRNCVYACRSCNSKKGLEIGT